MQERQSKPLIERADVWVSVFAAVVAVVVGATQQRPASAVALAIGIVVMLAGAAVFLIGARRGQRRRFPRAARLATAITSAVLLCAGASAFAVPASRQVLLHDVLGFTWPAIDVRIADVEIRENDTAYEIAVTVLNRLRTEQFADTMELTMATPCPPPAPTAPLNYRVDSSFRLKATDENGSQLLGKGFRIGDDGRFHSAVTGTMTPCTGGSTLDLRLDLDTTLPPGQHSTITIEIPRTLQVQDTRPDTPRPAGATTPSPPRKVTVTVTMPTPGESARRTGRTGRLDVTLTVGEQRTRITHTTT